MEPPPHRGSAARSLRSATQFVRSVTTIAEEIAIVAPSLNSSLLSFPFAVTICLIMLVQTEKREIAFPVLTPVWDDPLTAALAASWAPPPLKKRFLGSCIVFVTGRENDGVTGLYYYRARYYSPRMQRFVSNDPIGFAGGDWNLYAYVDNNPLRWIDPLGLRTVDPRDIDGGGGDGGGGSYPPIKLPGGGNPQQLPPWFWDRMREINERQPPPRDPPPWFPPDDPPPCFTVGGRKPHAC